MLPGKGHEGEDVDLGLVEEGGELGQLGAQLVGDVAPLFSGGIGRGLREGGGDEGRDNAAAVLAGVRQRVAHEVDAAALPASSENLGDGGLQPLVSVGDDELDAAQAAPRQLAQELVPERLGFRGADVEPEHLAPAVLATITAQSSSGR